MRYAGQRLSLSDFSTPGGGGAAGQAAGSGSKVADIYSSIAANAPRADEQAMIALEQRALNRAGVMAADEGVYSARKLADAQLESDKLIAKASKPESSGGGGIGSFIAPALSIATAFSDATMKHDIEPLEDALTTLRNLKPVTFYYNEEYSSSPERLHHGFIAQEYKEVLPDATYYDDSIGKLAIDTGDLIAILVSAVQTLESRVTRMEAENALKGAVR